MSEGPSDPIVFTLEDLNLMSTGGTNEPVASDAGGATPAATPDATPAAAAPTPAAAAAAPAGEAPAVTPAAPNAAAGGSDGDDKTVETPAAGDDKAKAPAASDDKTPAGEAVTWPEQGFPDDWKTRLVGMLPEDMREKGTKVLETRESIVAVMRGLMSADSKITELSEKAKNALPKPPGKDAKPEEVTAYKAAIGAPVSLDDYKIARPEGFKPTDADLALEKQVRETAYAINATQEQVDAFVQLDIERGKMFEQEMLGRIAKAKKDGEEELRIHFGVRNYDAGVRTAEQTWQKLFIECPDLINMRGLDGVALGEHPGFVKALARLGGEVLDLDPIEGEIGSGTDIEGEIKKIQGLMHSDVKEYERMQPQLDKLIAAKMRQSQRR